MKKILCVGLVMLSMHLQGAITYPLHDAIVNEDFDALGRLVVAGVDVNQSTQWGETPLHRVALACKFKILREIGPDYNDNEAQKAYRQRIQDFYITMAQFLIQSGADSTVTNNDGKTFLQLALDEMRTELVAYLAIPTIKEPEVL